MSTYWFTGCQHFGHNNIIKYCDRSFESVEEMDETIIDNFNSVVSRKDTIIHAGDFTLIKNRERVYKNYVNKLKGNHIFLRGSHDYWLPKSALKIFERKFDKNYIVVCHYAMRTWARSHYNSWQLYSHSHGRLESIGKQHDIGIDNNNFYPVSLDQIIEIMENRPDNPNLVKERRNVHL